MNKVIPLALAMTVSGCGFFGKDRGGRGGPDDEPSVHFDAAKLNAMNESLDLTQRDVVWTYRFAVDAEPRLAGENVTLAQLADEVSQETFRRTAELTFEISARDRDGGELLVSNLAPDATGAPEQAKKWRDNCAEVSPKTTFDQGVKVCDFAGIVVNPTLRLEPVNFKEDPRLVTWECTQANYDGNHDLNIVLEARSYATCRAGYAAPAGTDVSALPEMTLPADVSDHTFEMQTINALVRFTPGAPASDRYRLDSDELNRKGPLKLPVGKMEDCSTLEFQLLYKDSAAASTGVHKDARLKFHRSVGATALSWQPEDQTTMPQTAQIFAADQEQIRYWLTCRWYNQPGIELAKISY